MILYNVTVNIDQAAEEEWLQWMKSEHIPAVMATGYFSAYKLYRLLIETEGGGVNYSVQYFAENLTNLEDYLQHHAGPLVKEHNERYKDRHVAFRSVLQEVP